MTHLSIPSAGHRPTLAATAVVRTVAEALKAWRHRREVMRLADLDDHLLKDIGLTRSQVSGALARPLLADPSRVLARTAPKAGGKPRPVVPVAAGRRA